MLIATQSRNIACTSRYFDEVLTQGDYYLGQEINGRWQGKGAALLGVGHGSDVTKDQFDALLQGKHPITGEPLTQRNRKDRRPGMDLTFSVPKSVSLAWAINEDERLIDALRETVAETMAKDVEPLMHRRVRSGKHSSSEQKAATGKLIYADFLHKTSRPVDGVTDPHLHVHAFVINWTEDNGTHYAGQMEEIVRQRASLQAKFESRLARKLRDELGYGVRNTRFVQSGRVKAGWEIDGLKRETIDKFSRRTAQVEKHASEKGIRDAAKKATLGATTREKKDKGASVDRLRDEWQSRLTAEERAAFANLLNRSASEQNGDDAASHSLQYALDHHLYRQSTTERHQIIGTALEHALTVSPEEMERAMDRMDVLRKTIDHEGADRHFITTQEVLNAERQMITYARDARGTRQAIGSNDYEFQREWLNDQQKAAVRDVLVSRDGVVAVTGGAGTGKSSLMQEAGDAIEHYGKTLFTFTPSTGAKEVLQEKGFDRTQTVEHLIRNDKMHADLRGQVIWIDEAGLLDVRSMNAVFSIAKQQNARVVLSGDTKQHASPRRGEALRLLEHEAGLKIARVEAIQRQRGEYKKAIELISKGNEIDPATNQPSLLAGFDMLDRMGKIHEIDPETKNDRLASDYLELADRGQSTLVVAPTHHEAAEVTEKIRGSLRERGQLEESGCSLLRLQSLNLTEAQKREASTYAEQEGVIVQFHQNVPGGIQRGSRYRVAGAIGNEIRIKSLDDGSLKQLPRKMADRFEVYRETEVELAVGDKVRLTLGGTSHDGRRLSNGRLDEVKGFDGDGNVKLKSGFTLPKDYGHLDLGYVITSHASQGKDRDVAIAAMGSDSLAAINYRQFYVTASRGSKDVRLFVDDKAKVRRAIARSGEQMSATELIKKPDAAPKTTQQRETSIERQQQRKRALSVFRDRVQAWWQERRQQREPRQHANEPTLSQRSAAFFFPSQTPEQQL
ncbi:MobF family relaxase [Rhodopirellula europaea]|uniref:Conjugative relaxase domain protein n=1 Tax=Rhodopirellula europaea SH398 TaxID=1263868 RepID=M5RXQ1_9BACT|nr:MobF family relaxase [Rhodopirellula europaea]EMI24080.1 conjugative relaxase domain protein [Rhodopirellula europaea SH398]